MLIHWWANRWWEYKNLSARRFCSNLPSKHSFTNLLTRFIALHAFWLCCFYKLTFSLFFQAVLASSDAFRSVEDDFCHLQDTRTKLKSPQEEEQFEILIEQLRSRWEEVKRKIDELHPRVQVMAENFSEYKEKLQSLVHWVEEAEQTCAALERVQDYNEFQPLMQSFQVL